MSGPFGSSQWMYNAGGGFYGTEIDQSLRVAYGDNPELSRTNSSAPTNNSKGTLSFWMKRGLIGSGTGNNQYIIHTGSGTSNDTHMDLKIETGDILSIGAYSNTPITGTPKLRDVSSWYHIVVKFDSTSATASERQIKVYINGVEMAGTKGPVAQNQKFPWINQSQEINIFRHVSVNRPYDGYIAEMHLIDGQALDPTSFGETKSGIWIPKAYSGSYGTNGFHLEFAGNTNDTSGNGNNWTANNISASDYVLDSPTNNFAVLNNLDNISTTYSEGNLKITQSNYNYNSRGSFGLTSGKYYWEVRMDSTHGEFGVCENGKMPQTDPQTVYPAYFIYNNGSVGVIYNNATSTSSSSATMTNWTANDVAMIAYDADNGNLYHGLNGVWQNSANPAAGTGAIITGITTQFGGELVPFFGSGTSSARNWIVNFGQDSTFAGATTAGGNSDANGYGDFKYAPPSGYLSLCSANLPTGAIDTAADETPEDYFNTVLWTGNNTNNRSITGVGFQPSLVSAKSRSANSGFNWVDAVRGGTKNLQSNTTNAEATVNTVISFDSDGFTVGDGNGYDINKSGEPVVGWSWKAGGAGVSNTDGSITSTVSVGATSQQNWFSIVKYTGTGGNDSYGHGLGVAPNMIITKDMTDPANWAVYVSDIGTGKYLQLNLTAAPITNSVIYPSVSSTTIGVGVQGDGSITNTSGDNYISYCFANAEGLCKVGKYTGNSSADGTFVYTGFRPAYLLIKKYTAADEWAVHDNRRADYGTNSNPIDDYLKPYSSAPEGDDGPSVDFLSNGFKWRINSGMRNQSGQSYIYLAIAEQPFKYANAR